MNNTALVMGSLAQIAQAQNVSIAESFLNVDALILVDVSGSMDTTDSRGGQSRYDVALQELARLQGDLPGKLAVIGFSFTSQFVPNGRPVLIGSGTNLAGALEFVHVADDGDMRFIVISDGQPDDEKKALAVASKFKGRIDCVFVGREDDKSARAFLEKLAKRSGGQAVLAAQVLMLGERVEQLLIGTGDNG